MNLIDVQGGVLIFDSEEARLSLFDDPLAWTIASFDQMRGQHSQAGSEEGKDGLRWKNPSLTKLNAGRYFAVF